MYDEKSGTKTIITQSIVSPKIEGAIITAEGGNNTNTKANIIQAVEAVTGLPTHKIQVFEMEKQIKFARERNDSKMQILKKNQVIIFVIALMFVAAGYLSFTSNNAIPTAKLANSEEMAAIGDATLVNANAITEEITEEKENKPSEEPVIGTSVQITQDEYFSQSRLDRDTMYSQMIESYQKILENDNVTTEQKI